MDTPSKQHGAQEAEDELTPQRPSKESASRQESGFDRREAVDRLLHQSERVLTEVRKLGSIATETAGEAVTGTRSAGVHAVEAGRERVADARRGLEGYVEREPLKALLIAAGIGVAVGIWSRR